MRLAIREDHLFTDHRGTYRAGEPMIQDIDSSIFEGDSFEELKRDLYKHCLREYGRPRKAYIDDRAGRSHQIGWVFSRRRPFEDSPETYLDETWISIEERINGKLVPVRFDDPNLYEGC